MGQFIDQFIENIISGIPNVITALLIFLVSLYLARVFSRLVHRLLDQQEAAPGVTHLLVQLTRWSILAIGIITALQRFFDVTAFLAGLGIIGFTVGFALQNVMQNFAAGVILLLQQPFKVGEVVRVAGYDGTILVIDMRTTGIKTLDGRMVILPNADILASPIENYTRSERRRIELPVGVAYGSDPATTRKVVLEAIQAVPGYVGEPAPVVAFHTFASSSIDLSAFFWIDTSITTIVQAQDAALEQVKAALEKNHIEIPYPIRVMYSQ